MIRFDADRATDATEREAMKRIRERRSLIRGAASIRSRIADAWDRPLTSGSDALFHAGAAVRDTMAILEGDAAEQGRALARYMNTYAAAARASRYDADNETAIIANDAARLLMQTWLHWHDA